MQRVSDLLERKGRHVFTVDPTESVVHCARLMFEHGVGSLVVLRDGAPAGIVTRNDVVELVGKRPDSVQHTAVREIMSTDLEVTGAKADLLELRDHMVGKEIRHMPVVEDGELVGLITLADVLFLELSEAHVMNKNLEAYIFGPYS